MLRHGSATFASVLCVTLVVALDVAAQERSRVVLVSSDDALVAALEPALAPWEVEIVVVGSASPASAMPAAADRGAELARAYDAVAVAWISVDESGPALWMYDRNTDRVLARRLPSAPPFDEPTAAAAALSIKTLLRHSSAAPIEQRIVEPPRESNVRLEVGGGMRAFSTSPADAEPRFLLGLSLWPLVGPVSIGFSFTARGGTGVGLTTALLSGRLLSFELHAGAWVRWLIARPIDLTVGMELGASLADLQASAAGTALERIDVDPTVHGLVELGARALSVLRIALRVGAVVDAITRSYLIRGQTAFETQTVALLAELLFQLPLDGGSLDVR